MFRNRLSFSRRSLFSLAMAVSLISAGTTAPASAYDMVSDPDWQAMNDAAFNTSDILYNCEAKLGIRVESRSASGYTLIEGTQYSNGVDRVVISRTATTSADGITWKKANDPAAGLVNGELYYAGRNYVWRVEEGKWKTHKLSDALAGLDAPADSFVETLRPPTELGPVAPLEVCDANSAIWDTAALTIAAAGMYPEAFTSGPQVSANPDRPSLTDYQISEQSPAGNASVTLTVDARGIAYGITATAETGLEKVTTTLTLLERPYIVEVPRAPYQIVYKEWELSKGMAITTLRNRISPWATKVSSSAKKAAAKLKGKFKNKMTQNIIRASAKSVVTKSSRITIKNIAGGVELSASTNGYTSSICLVASKGKLLKYLCY